MAFYSEIHLWNSPNRMALDVKSLQGLCSPLVNSHRATTLWTVKLTSCCFFLFFLWNLWKRACDLPQYLNSNIHIPHHSITMKSNNQTRIKKRAEENPGSVIIYFTKTPPLPSKSPLFKHHSDTDWQTAFSDWQVFCFVF